MKAQTPPFDSKESANQRNMQALYASLLQSGGEGDGISHLGSYFLMMVRMVE